MRSALSRTRKDGLKEVRIDPDKFSTGYGGVAYVRHGTFSSDRHPTELPKDPDVLEKDFEAIRNESTACFAGLLNRIKERGANRVYYTTFIPKLSEEYINSYRYIAITPEETIRWLQMSREHGCLPSYVDEESIKKIDKDVKYAPPKTYGVMKRAGTIVLDVSELTQAQLYLYLSTYRSPSELPGFVRAMIHLVDECKMNYYAAYAWTSRALSAGSHHTLYVPLPYGYSRSSLESLCKITVPIRAAIGLRRFVDDPKKYDDRMATDGGGFICSGMLAKISKVKKEVPLQKLFNEGVVKAVMSLDDKDSKKYLEKVEGLEAEDEGQNNYYRF